MRFVAFLPFTPLESAAQVRVVREQQKFFVVLFPGLQRLLQVCQLVVEPDAFLPQTLYYLLVGPLDRQRFVVFDICFVQTILEDADLAL